MALSEIGFMMVVAHIYRRGFGTLGAANEVQGVSVMANIGSMPQDSIYASVVQSTELDSSVQHGVVRPVYGKISGYV